MSLTKQNDSKGSLIYALAVVSLTIAGLWFGAQYNSTAAQNNSTTIENVVPAATFAATPASLGAIPDGPGTPNLCGTDGAAKDVTFTVSGISGAPTTVAVNMTFGAPVHTYAGDITAVLIAPNGASQTLFGYTGSTIVNGCGDSSDLAGPYNFLDAAVAPPSGGWWQAATTAGAAAALATGDYRTTAKGGAGATNPQPPTNLTPAFSGVSNPNGTWTLRLTDGGGGDTGAISAATLTIEGGVVVNNQHVLDYNGDGKTDFVVVRNTGGGPSGQLTWFINLAGTGTTYASDWGINSDFRIAGDYDGDQKTDITIWRPGAPTVAAFYILQSQTNTVRIEPFGQTGDDPTIVEDYNGDGKDDVAVYRAGANSGDPSTWYFRTTAGGAVTYVNWGQNGDFVAPGDYDGDGKGDFVIQRNNGGGQAKFWMFQTTAGIAQVVFGTPTDVILPGDYDGDGKTDIATIRGSAGQYNWYVRPSSTGIISGAPTATFGASATDFPAQGDYDGDGKTDVAIWRPSATPGASAFWVQGSTAGTFSIPFGANGDYPVANYNSH